MGTRGPKPKPNEEKRRLGNPGHRPLPAEADVVHLAPAGPPDEPPEPHAPLGVPGMKSWARAWMEGWHWLAASDADVVLWYCESVDDYAMLRQQLVTMIAANENDPRIWRFRKQTQDARAEVTRLAARLGLDPIARSELGVAEVRVAEGVAAMMERAPTGSKPTITIDAKSS